MMIDLVCLVADANMKAAVDGLFARPESLGIRRIQFEILVHPQRDPGCFNRSTELLEGYRDEASHALVLLDRAWDGVPADNGDEVERLLEERFKNKGLGNWLRAVVIDPELEVWVFSDSPHVATELGWQRSMDDLKATLQKEGFWRAKAPKPSDPKAAMDWTLHKAQRPRSSSIFRKLASKVSLRRCEDRAFCRLINLLKNWFSENRQIQ